MSHDYLNRDYSKDGRIPTAQHTHFLLIQSIQVNISMVVSEITICQIIQ